ncbi:MAG: hypothetical protein ACI8ZM_003910 [Crocinitomix sp.]|jgi:hypothetical protein
MKRIFLIGLALITYVGVYGQMSENFDSRTVGEYMGVVSPNWTTWSGAVGGVEDVAVSNVMSESGANSIYFSTLYTIGGPQDVVVPFGGEFNTGSFVFESAFYIEDNKGAYFNIQGESTVGTMYSMYCQMLHDGRLNITTDGSGKILTTYPPETWFTLTLMVNLNTNDWEVYIDGVIQGKFSNKNNQVASADLFPVNNVASGGNNLAGYYMDNVSYNHTPYTLPAVNLGATQIINTNGLASASVSPSVIVRNLGTTDITSFDVSLEYNGTTIDETVTDVSISSLDYYTVDFAGALGLIPGENEITATVSNVNGGGADDDVTDDIKVETFNSIVPAPDKIVVGEVATGTWSGWCPRGTAYLDFMADVYPDHFIGIAVHNNDLMEVDYDIPIGLISGYPNLYVDRRYDIDPLKIELAFLKRVVLAPLATITLGCDYTDGATSMNVSVTGNFIDGTMANYRMALIVIEDNVTGTDSDYSQANNYAGGAYGEMGGFEVLPNPVPAADMVYDNVARVMLPIGEDTLSTLPDYILTGEVHTVSFSVDIDPEWDMDEIQLVGILIGPCTINNAGIATIEEAAHNGYSNIQENPLVSNSINLYPNPTEANTTIDFGRVENENVRVEVYDMNGKLVGTRDYGILNGNYTLPLALSNLERGIYNVRLFKGKKVEQSKLIIE